MLRHAEKIRPFSVEVMQYRHEASLQSQWGDSVQLAIMHPKEWLECFSNLSELEREFSLSMREKDFFDERRFFTAV